jgi:hypothetical protein
VGVKATAAEVAAPLPGDEIVARPDVVMDTAVTLPAPPAAVWPWLVQLGKRRGGWYAPARVERFVPRGRRPARTIVPALQGLAVGDVIPDWGGRDATFEVVRLEPDRCLVHRSTRGTIHLSWALVLRPVAGGQTRLQFRLRMAGLKRPVLAERFGRPLDAATIVVLGAGLRERLEAGRGDAHG